MIEGVGATYGSDGDSETTPQQALEHAGRRYFERCGRRPTHAALSKTLDPKSLELWTLELVPPYGTTNVVIVGHLQGDNGDKHAV